MKTRFQKIRFVLKSIRYFKKNSIFYRIFFAVLLISVCLCAFNFISMRYIKSIMLNKEVKSQETYLDYNSARVNNVIEKIENAVNLIQFDREVISLLSNFERIPNGYNEVEDFNRVTQQMSLIKLNNEAVRSIFIYLYKDDIIIEPTGTIDNDVFYLNRYRDGFYEWKRNMKKKYRFYITVLDELKNKVSSSDLSDVNVLNTLYNNAVPFATLIINLDMNYIKALFLDNEFSKERGIAIINEDKKTIGRLPAVLYSDMNMDYDRIYSGKKGSFISKDGFLLEYAKSSAGNLYYVISAPKASVYKSVTNVFFVSNVILLVFFIMGIIFALYMSQRIYFPISSLVDFLKPMSMWAGNTYFKQNELDFIRNNLSQMVAGYASKEKIANESIPLIIEALFKKIISGDRDISSTISIIHELNFKFGQGYYFIAVIKVYVLYDQSEDQKDPDSSLEREIGRNVRHYFSNNVLSIFKTKENETVLVMFIENAEYISYIRYGFLDFYRQTFEQREGFSAYIGIGMYYKDIFRMDKSYESSLAAIEQRSINEMDRVLLYDEKNSFPVPEISVPNDMEQRFFNYVTSGNIKAVKEYLDEILNVNSRHDVPFKSFRNLAVLLQNFILRIVDDIPEDNIKLNVQLEKDIEKILDVCALKDKIIRSYTEATVYFLEKGSESLFEKILGYIDENLKNDISLDLIADEVGLTPNYLTRYFKKHKGINFKSYLNNKRIEAAKYLLLNTDKTIKEIAELSGYNSPNFFISTFKRFEGISPSEFRKRHFAI